MSETSKTMFITVICHLLHATKLDFQSSFPEVRWLDQNRKPWWDWAGLVWSKACSLVWYPDAQYLRKWMQHWTCWSKRKLFKT